MKSRKLPIAIIILLLSGCGNEPVKTKGPDVASVKIVQVAPETISIPVHSTGILVSSEEMKLSFKTGGIIADIHVREGEKVKKGDLLASLNLSEINAQVNLARNGFDKATRDYNRVKNLYADSVTTLEQLQNVTTALDVAKSNLDVARFNLTHSIITAPEDGVILRQFVKTNELVASGYPVFLFGCSGKNWKVKTGLSDRDIVRINPGDSAIITLDAWTGIKFSASVDQVGEMSNPMTGTYEIEMVLDKNNYRLATGFIAGVSIFPSRKETFIMIPVGAIVDANGNTGYAYAVTDSMTVQKIKVEIVTIYGTKAAIRGNLNAIKQIVSEGAAYLRDGESVKIVR
jgi:membrane fusion protein, multidrug efflux system